MQKNFSKINNIFSHTHFPINKIVLALILGVFANTPKLASDFFLNVGFLKLNNYSNNFMILNEEDSSSIVNLFELADRIDSTRGRSDEAIILLYLIAKDLPNASFLMEKYENKNKLVEIGNAYLVSGNWEVAKIYLEAALSSDPSDDQARLYMGLIYVHYGQYEEALKEFELISLDKSDSLSLANQVELLMNKALVLENLGRYDDAKLVLKLVTQYREPKEDIAKALYKLALLSESIDDSISYLEESVTLFPNMDNLYLLAETIYTNKGDTQKSNDIFEQAISYADSWFNKYQLSLNIGLFFEKNDEVILAEIWYMNAIDTYYEGDWGHAYFGRLKYNSGEYEVALSHIKTALNLNPDNPVALEILRNMTDSTTDK